MSANSKREAILVALKTLLEGISSPASLSDRVFRSRKDGVDREEGIAVIIEPIRDDPDVQAIWRYTWTFVVRITLVVRGNPPDQVADPYVKAIHEAIMTSNRLGLDNMVLVQPAGTNFEMLDSDAGAGQIPMDFIFSYQTSDQSLENI